MWNDEDVRSKMEELDAEVKAIYAKLEEDLLEMAEKIKKEMRMKVYAI